MTQEPSARSVPKHIGFILDGNRRWARQNGLPDYEGHLAGYNALTEVLEAVYDQGVTCVSIYIFSTENWKREKQEVSFLMKLALRLATSEVKQLVRRGVRMRFLGRPDGVEAKLLGAIHKAEETTKDLTKGTLAVCFNYGGQLEIADAVRACIRDGLQADDVTPEAIGQRLYAPDIPPLDLIVRTSGEQRLSNFMLWRSSYSEFMFLDKFWPDMTKDDVTAIIETYTKRSRRFGG